MGFFLCYIIPLIVVHILFALIGRHIGDNWSASYAISYPTAGMWVGLIICLVATLWNREELKFGYKMHAEGEHYVYKKISYIRSYFRLLFKPIVDLLDALYDDWFRCALISMIHIPITLLLTPIMLIQDLLFAIFNRIYFSILEINNEKAKIHLEQGLDYSIKKDYDNAVSEFTKAIKLTPNNSKAYYNRGSVYFNCQKYYNAISDYSKVIKLEPNNSKAYYNRGTAYYYSKGDRGIVVANFEKALEINPNYKKAQEALEVLFKEEPQLKNRRSDIKRKFDSRIFVFRCP